MIQATSRLAFYQTVSEREVQCQRLLGLYLSGAMSDREASQRLDWFPSQVSARRNSLMKLGKVCEMGRKRDPDTGKTVNVYGVLRETLFD